MGGNQLMLTVWREACRHIDIAECLEAIAPALLREVPADVIAVRAVNFGRQTIDTVALVSSHSRRAAPLPRTPCSPGAFRSIVGWCARREVLRGTASNDALGLLALPNGARSYIAGPLAAEGVLGALVVEAAAADVFGEADEAIVAELLEPLSVALANHSRLRELARLREALEADKRALLSRLGRQQVADAIVGAEGGLRDVMARVDQVARTDVPVLLFGETGTGKEVIARALHARSPRAEGPIMRVNCGALPPGLIDSELFGHERGSFTGATDSRKGWFERANGGTLFLDEIGELPLEAQVRLLRILQDGTYERVGGQKTLSADVRIVAATHRNLHEMVEKGTFREDLWYRLAVFPIYLPPVRERVADIPALARHLAAKTGIRLAGRPLIPTQQDVDLLLTYDWPGNVRELGAVIERAGILGDGKTLRIAAALGTVVPREAGRSAFKAGRVRAVGDTAAATLDQAMVQHIERALVESHGRIEGPFGAAARLGINPHTLRARMRKLRVDWTRFRTPSASRTTTPTGPHTPASRRGGSS